MSNISRYHHRQVAMTINLKPTIDEINKHFLRVIEQVKPLFLNKGRLAHLVQKRWYGEQLVDIPTAYTYGYIHFTVTNRKIMNINYDLDNPDSEVDDLEFSFHIKQNDTIVLASNFTSGSVRYKMGWGEFSPERVLFNLYCGTDIESAILFRDLVIRAKDQLLAFKADETTLIGQNELQLVNILMPNT